VRERLPSVNLKHGPAVHVNSFRSSLSRESVNSNALEDEEPLREITVSSPSPVAIDGEILAHAV
jgi:hypothetical protein